MRGFLIGVIFAALALVGAAHYYCIYEIDALTKLGVPSNCEDEDTITGEENGNVVDTSKPCWDADDDDCVREHSIGLSGLAHIDANRFLAVHDTNTGEIAFPRLSIMDVHTTERDGKKEIEFYSFTPLEIDARNWRKHPFERRTMSNGEEDTKAPFQQLADLTDLRAHEMFVANDLESVCKLDGRENEFLIAESGLVYLGLKKKGEASLTDNNKLEWQGRIFHVALKLDGSTKPEAVILQQTNKLKLPALGDPYLPTDVQKFAIHSPEDFEGLACAQLDDAGKYMVLLGNRGGGTHRLQDGDKEEHSLGRLHWGILDFNSKPEDLEISWQDENVIKNIKAPGKPATANDAEWRDISGLHIDDKGLLFATAAWDSGEDYPPFAGILYQLGVVCIDEASDKHSRKDLCQAAYDEEGDVDARARPVLLPDNELNAPSNILSSSDHHKFESVAASINSAKLSVGAEDEKAGGAWWPDVQIKN